MRLEEELLPLEMFLDTVTMVESDENDGAAQLIMWNSVIRRYNRRNSDPDGDGSLSTVFICSASKFPLQSFQEFVANINTNYQSTNQLRRQKLKQLMMDTLFVRELDTLNAILAHLKEMELRQQQLIQQGSDKPLVLILQDLGYLLSFETARNFAAAHSTSTQIFMMLRKLSKLYRISVIVSPSLRLFHVLRPLY